MNESIRECEAQFAEKEREEQKLRQDLEKLRQDAVQSQHAEESDLTKLKQLQRVVSELSEKQQKIQQENNKLENELQKWRNKKEQLAESDQKQQEETVHFLIQNSAQIRELALLNMNLEQDQDQEVGQDATDARKKVQSFAQSLTDKTLVRKDSNGQQAAQHVSDLTFRVAGSASVDKSINIIELSSE